MNRWQLSLLALVLAGCGGAETAPFGAEPRDPSPPMEEEAGEALVSRPGTPMPSAPDAGAPDARACEATSPRSAPVVVRVLPDEGEAPYVDVLSTAAQSIRVFGYMMGYGATFDTLKAKAQAGVNVRIILDGEKERSVNEKYRVALEAAGAHVEWSDAAFTYMHAKSIVVDDVHALVSTGNYGKSFLLKERNFVAATDDPQDVADLAALFDADWNRTSPDLSCTRLVVSPVNSHDRIVALIASAQSELLIESMQFADKKVRAAVLARAQAGVTVKVIVATPSWITANANAGEWLAQNGIPGKVLTEPHVHVKAIVVDGARAYLGSENLSTTSLDHNREVGLVVTDAPAVGRMRATFEADFAIAQPF